MRWYKKRLCRFAGALVALLLMTLITGLFYILHAPSTPFVFPDAAKSKALIAHGGAIDGHVYTNSKEALELAARNGFTLVEIDLRLTSDGHIAAAHSWKDFHQMTIGSEEKRPPSLQELQNRRIYGIYTPLDAHLINNFFLAHPDMFLITDKIKDYKALLKQIHISQDRMMVEVFSISDYLKALYIYGIRYPMLCIWNIESFKKNLWLINFLKISMITIPTDAVPSIENELEILYKNGITIFAFTTDDKEYIKKYLDRCVTSFYTNTLTPDTVP